MKPLQTGITVLLIVVLTGGEAFSEPLVYSGRQQQENMDPANVDPAGIAAVPVIYGTDYGTQFAPYSSFMQPPVQSHGPLQQQYQNPYVGPYNQAAMPPSGVNPATAGQMDPLGASEVSPYSRYSPYMEVIGEGSNYTLGIDDVVTIIVRNQPDFSGRFIVDPEGDIQYNFVGDIPAVGLTKEELKQEIINRLQRFVRYPEVAVMISEYRSKAVYVLGYINSPGKYAMKGDKITVKEAVIAAGLPRSDGALKRVYVIRPDKNTKSGEPEKKKVNLKDLLEKGKTAEDFLLEPGDTIIVHQRYYDKFVNNFSRLIGPLFQAASVYELGFGGDSNGYLRKDSN
ncbi:MAG: polysaccharide export protein [Candidatus Omnitrophica bacterium]|nr:polysaccharide export protein [Candidatus Omnitrophota bacterium]